jgi:phage shock protein A
MTEDKKLYKSEEQRLREELKNLSKVLTALEGDIRELKQGHNTLQ